MTAPQRHPLLRITLAGLGILCLGLAGLGFALPGLPGTPFLLLAAACFARSSPRLHGWLLANRLFGPIVHNWQESRSIPRRAKRLALATLAVAAAISLYSLPKPSHQLALLAVLTIPLIILIRLKETEAVAAAKKAGEMP